MTTSFSAASAPTWASTVWPSTRPSPGFVQVTGCHPSYEERGQLAGLDSRYTEKEKEKEKEPPVLFRRFVDALHGQRYGSPMAGELHGLPHLPSDGDTLRVGVPQQRLTAWLQERAGVVVVRAARQASPSLGVTVELVWVGGGSASAENG